MPVAWYQPSNASCVKYPQPRVRTNKRTTITFLLIPLLQQALQTPEPAVVKNRADLLGFGIGMAESCKCALRHSGRMLALFRDYFLSSPGPRLAAVGGIRRAQPAAINRIF